MVFLLLYVTSSLRTGTFSIQKHQEYQRLTQELENLKEQNQVYNTLKDDHLSNDASRSEQKVYKELMDKLSLLQEEAKIEKNALRKRARENEEKEEALNHYQRIIRNILNVNVLAKAGLKKRDKVIRKKQTQIDVQLEEISQKTDIISENEKTISEKQLELEFKQKVIDQKKKLLTRKSQEVKNLNEEITQKKNTIAKNNQKIASINADLAEKIESLQQTKMSRTKLKKEIDKIQKESENKIQDLKEQNNQYSADLNYSRAQISNANAQLEKAQETIDAVNSEKQNLSNELKEKSRQFAIESKKMQTAFDDEIKQKEQQFKDQLKKQRMSAAERKKKERQLQKEIAKQKSQFKSKMSDLKNKIDAADKKRLQAEKDADKYKEYLESVKKQNEELAGDIETLRPLVQARRDLARKIKKNLEEAGLKSEVDAKTGDVILSFGDEYFDTDRAGLKGNMKSILKKFIPSYSKSILGDSDLAEKISSVEIIGFASPTYKGKFIDPQSLSSEDRDAVRYNLDLSYKRAKSIFDYIFDTRKMNYRYQKKLLPLVKVTGRSFLSKGIAGKDISSGMTRKKYCKKYNCKKEQRVIIKFNLSN